jgi:hypothetical protein
LLGQDDGVLRLLRPPAEAAERASPASGSSNEGKHLWVFFEEAIPYILESAPRVSPPLDSGVAKHSNLTGGGAAHCGGEIWVDPADAQVLYVNGASGRYGPETPEQLADAIAVFVSLGFRVTSFGWDEDAGRPARVLRD